MYVMQMYNYWSHSNAESSYKNLIAVAKLVHLLLLYETVPIVTFFFIIVIFF